MGRFHRKRGDSLYMFFVETDDVDALAKRLEARGSKFAPRPRDKAGMPELFIHPTAFNGVLVGVSRTEHAWTWSGDPERARRAAHASIRIDQRRRESMTLVPAGGSRSVRVVSVIRAAIM